MKYQEISETPKKELVKKCTELKETLFSYRMKNALGQLENPMLIRHARRDIARLETAIRKQSK